MMWLRQWSGLAQQSWYEASLAMEYQHAKAEAQGMVPWVLFGNLFTSMFNDCEISEPLIQTYERSPLGLLCALKLFKYFEAGKREKRGMCLIIADGGSGKAQLSKKGSQAGEVVSATELDVWAGLRVPVSRLKSGGELPPFLTSS